MTATDARAPATAKAGPQRPTEENTHDPDPPAIAAALTEQHIHTVRGKGKSMKLSKVIAIPALALTGGLSLAACGSVKAPTAAPGVTHTVTAPAAAPKLTTPVPAPLAPAPAQTVYMQAPAAPAPAPPALTNCGRDVYAGADTTCPFALNVAADYTGLGVDYAYSPVTGLDYPMSCDGGSGARDLVTCTGGDNALVEFYY